jgi:hypothetical protein
MNRNEYDAWLEELTGRHMRRRRYRNLERPVEAIPEDHFDIDEDMFSDITSRPEALSNAERIIRAYAASTGRTVEDIISGVPSTLHVALDTTPYQVTVAMDYSDEPVRAMHERVRSACEDVSTLMSGTPSQIARAGLVYDRIRLHAARDAVMCNGVRMRIHDILPNTWRTALRNSFVRVAKCKIIMALYQSGMRPEQFEPFVQTITHRFLGELFPHENHLINEPGIGRGYAFQILWWLSVGLEQVESEGVANKKISAKLGRLKKADTAVIAVRKIRIRRDV